MFCITASNPSPPWQCTLPSPSIAPILLMTSLSWRPLGGSLVVIPYLMQHPQAQTGFINGSKHCRDAHLTHTSPTYHCMEWTETVIQHTGAAEQFQNGCYRKIRCSTNSLHYVYTALTWYGFVLFGTFWCGNVYTALRSSRLER